MKRKFPLILFAISTATSAFAGLPDKGSLSSGSKATLNGGVYTVEGNVTIANTTAGQSAVDVGGDAAIFLKEGATLTVKGASSSGRTVGGGAGIYLPNGRRLVITGRGTVNATGGAATNGGNGSQGGVGSVTGDDSYGGNGGSGGAFSVPVCAAAFGRRCAGLGGSDAFPLCAAL